MTPQRAALEDERRRLAEQVAESTWDLGGLVYEMAVRDHFRVDVLAQRAAVLQRLDARLSEVERLAEDHAGIAGSCRFCGAPHGRSAEYCWSCGERIIVRQVLGTIEGTVREESTREHAPAAEPAPAAPETAGPRTVPIDPDGEFEVPREGRDGR
ncbi:hypothetical protein [Patulibacter minatonensis]|uniref:hypothetical protein n=1 Tax=Patulibacter minatonensis TaxID=298163 RepID=UPI00146FC2C7|nr:hypothetical protein [Patulibacter minatonensis]